MTCFTPDRIDVGVYNSLAYPQRNRTTTATPATEFGHALMPVREKGNDHVA